MQFKALPLLALAAVAAAVALPGGGGNAGNIAINEFTEKCKSQGWTVICCKTTSSGASKSDLNGTLNNADVTCNRVPPNVRAGTLAQTQAQCGGGLGCCSSDAIEKGVVSTDGCSGFTV
ncbi:hypothetical protein C7212DRAFT_327603 [Tuber magnatum]|uniref:Hydrophobin n=1 Tax=Tuber magnatum TaxID=42249 RepID=A0A317SJU0_9PEZI|nr:hypothetical protein C7212DRAFT_327603 [Tuber magnatum]